MVSTENLLGGDTGRNEDGRVSGDGVEKWHVAIPAKKTRLLVINPNSSKDMTEAMIANLGNLSLSSDVEISAYTAPPSAPASINDNLDMLNSYKAVTEDIEAELARSTSSFDGVLVACFSRHKLVGHFASNFVHRRLLVTGIFEASVLGALAMAPPGGGGGGGGTTTTTMTAGAAPRAKWGIVTTGAYWEKELAADVEAFLGARTEGSSFAGVVSTGLNAGDFHSVPESEIRQRLGDATRKLLDKKDVRCVIMGCAGMAGLEEIIRTVAVERYGELEGRDVLIIDSVKAGIIQLEQMVRYNRVFR